MFIVYAGSGIDTCPSTVNELFNSIKDEDIYAQTTGNFLTAQISAEQLMVRSMGNAMANRIVLQKGFGYVFELDENFNLIKRFETTAQTKILRRDI